MNAIPVPGTPALTIGKSRKSLVVADLHIGIELDLRERGIIIPSQTGEIGERLLSLCEAEGPERLIVLGDVRHNIPVPSRSEARGLFSLFERLLEVTSVEVVPGNHDGLIGELVPRGVKVHTSRGVTVWGVGLAHGHSWPSKAVMRCREVVIGHNHPSISFRDSLGLSTTEQCWLRGPVDQGKAGERYPDARGELIVMPSFTQLRSGTQVNMPDVPLLGPLLANGYADVGSMDVYLLDGTYLGKVEGLIDDRSAGQ